MLFQNLPFFILCSLTLLLYWSFSRFRLGVLAIASAIFYLAAGWENLLLFLAASSVTYTLGRHVTAPRGRWALTIGIALNLANLACFKYATFLASSLQAVFALPWLLPEHFKQILLPIGISFYTFQNISYLVDRRIKGLPSATSYLHYWVYISFFGHSIAGPIMRGGEFLPQVAQTLERRFDGTEFQRGVALFSLGLFKKVVIADRLAFYVDPLFRSATTLTTGQAWAAALMFTFQIYFDFSAYSDMAVGVGHMFGYHLTLNFRTPYLAGNASEFWRRWHITLSAWIRDYVYIPLGGSRVVASRQQLNVFVAMVASGLWHGAAWTFVFWGAYHGVLQVGLRHWQALKSHLNWRFFDSWAYRAGAVAIFFALIVFGWVLFRATSLEDAWLIMGRMLDPRGLASFSAVRTSLGICAGLYALHVIEDRARAHETSLARWWVERMPLLVQGAVYAGVILLVMVSYDGPQDFIYFRF